MQNLLFPDIAPESKPAPEKQRVRDYVPRHLGQGRLFPLNEWKPSEVQMLILQAGMLHRELKELRNEQLARRHKTEIWEWILDGFVREAAVNNPFSFENCCAAENELHARLTPEQRDAFEANYGIRLIGITDPYNLIRALAYQYRDQLDTIMGARKHPNLWRRVQLACLECMREQHAIMIEGGAVSAPMLAATVRH